MSTWLKAGLMVLGAACVLLLAGGFPLLGAPAVYHGGAMLVAGVLAGLLCAWGGWRLSKGCRLRFLAGVACTFFAGAGAGAVGMFGSQGVENAMLGGAMWFGAAAMFCLAGVGLIFVGVFGFFAWRAMYRRLWLAAIHWALTLMAVGAFLDYNGEVVTTLCMVPGMPQPVTEVAVGEEKLPLGFSLKLEKFDVDYYPGTGSYSLYRWMDGHWVPCGKPELKDGCLVLGDRSWKVEDLRPTREIQRPCLLGKHDGQMELLLQDNGGSPTVRNYCATCVVESDHRGRKESRTVDIRVNEPLSFKGWVIYLSSWRPMGDGVLVEFTARRAPGRLLTLAGMIGLVITTTCWCWKRREDEAAAPAKQNEKAKP